MNKKLIKYIARLFSFAWGQMSDEEKNELKQKLDDKIELGRFFDQTLDIDGKVINLLFEAVGDAAEELSE